MFKYQLHEARRWRPYRGIKIAQTEFLPCVRHPICRWDNLEPVTRQRALLDKGVEVHALDEQLRCRWQ